MVQSNTAKDAAALSREFEARAEAFAELVRGLDAEQWLAVTEAEQWPVGTTAHHVGQSIAPLWDFAGAMLANNVPPITLEALNAANAEHAANFPNPDRPETLALIEESAARVAKEIAALDDAQLDHGAVVGPFGPDPLPVRAWLEMVVIGHFDVHGESIKATVGA